MTAGPHRLGVLLGDGIGPEVVPAAVDVVDAALAAAGAEPVEWVELPVGRSAIESHGSATPPSTVEALADLLEDGDTIAARVTWRGTLAATGQALTAHIATFTQVRDGRIFRHATYDCYEALPG